MSDVSPTSFTTFGELLKHLRLGARLTQEEFGLAVGYSRAHVARLESGQRLPDVTMVKSVLVPALHLEHEPDLTARLVELAAAARGGESDSPLLAPPAVHPTNLPVALTRFVGREREVGEVSRLLSAVRLLTLTGSGGAGKTRLAQQVAATALAGYADGVQYVELAALADPERVAVAVASAIGLSVTEGSDLRQLTDFLGGRQALLVLDNCEHLIDGVATLTVSLLRTCPRLSILATSREALNVEGEVAWRVPPMQPDEAARLFIERAQAVRPDLAFNPQDATIHHVCERLDGMPLAIELAAARLQGMSLADLAARLDDRFSLLTSGRRTALPRHQTLRATIDWSYDLLSEAERILFRRLAVFVGGWTTDLAEQVCSDSPRLPDSPAPSLPSADVLPLLLQLVSKSLVVMEEHMEEHEGETRYRYLETIREYAHEKLAEHGELEALQRRHAEAFTLLADQFHFLSHGPQQRSWVMRLERDYPNLDAALTWSFRPHGDTLIGCCIFADLQVLWYSAAHQFDTLRWARLARDALTEQTPPHICGGVWLISTAANEPYLMPDEMVAGYWRALDYYTAAGDQVGMADAMGNIGVWFLHLGEHDAEGWRMLEQSAELARATGDTLIEHCSLKAQGVFAQRRGEFERAETLYQETIRLCRERGDLANLSRALLESASMYMDRRRFRKALSCAEEAVEVGRQVIDVMCEIAGDELISENSRFLGDLPRAVASAEKSLALAHERLPEEEQVVPLVILSKALIAKGEYARAQALLNEALHIDKRVWPTPPSGAYSGVYNAMACVAACQGYARRAATLFGAADGEIQLVKGFRPACIDWEFDTFIARARAVLGNEGFEAVRAEGRTMTREQAVAYALRDEGAMQGAM
jgi:predicted ATPase